MNARIARRFKAIVTCKACSLHRNQCPLVDKLLAPRADVCWVGLSAKARLQADARPLSEETRSGAIIGEIESLFPSLVFYRTNLVKCPPMQNDRLRYPTTKEMTSCSPNVFLELKITRPQIVILLGRQVIDFFMGMSGLTAPVFDEAFSYQPQTSGIFSAPLLGVHHPSFVNVYRRKRLGEYTNGVARAIEDICKVAPTLSN